MEENGVQSSEKQLSAKALAKRQKWAKSKEKKGKKVKDNGEAAKMEVDNENNGENQKNESSGFNKRLAKREERRKLREQKMKQEWKALRRIEKKKKIDKRKESKRKTRAGYKKKVEKETLFSEPNNTGQIDDKLSNLPPLYERNAYFHDINDVKLVSNEYIKNNLNDKQRHKYFTKLTEQSHNILSLLHESLNVIEKSSSTAGRLSIEEELTSDMIRLKNVPLAKRYIEMTLWKRIVRFQNNSMSVIRNLNYGAKDITSSNEKARDDLKTNNQVHEDDSTDLKFNSFRDKYLTNILQNHEAELHRVRRKEIMDLDQVKFLRQCLDSSASLYANIKCWDDEHHEKPANINT